MASAGRGCSGPPVHTSFTPHTLIYLEAEGLQQAEAVQGTPRTAEHPKDIDGTCIAPWRVGGGGIIMCFGAEARGPWEHVVGRGSHMPQKGGADPCALLWAWGAAQGRSMIHNAYMPARA